MPTFEQTIEVAAPPERAFGYVADFTTIVDWDPGIVQSRRVNNGPPGVGATYDVVALFRGGRVPFRYAVTEFEDARRLVFRGEGAKARSVDEILFEPAGAGSRITYRAELTMKGLHRLAAPFFGPTFAGMGRKALAGLKTQLDGAR
jgi:carbon monoxide dehydrogenase subunit G